MDGSDNDHQKKKKKAKRRRRRKSTSDAEHEVAVGSDAGDAEEMECHASDNPDDDEYSFYEPDIGEEVRDVDQGVEVEVEEIGEVGEDNDDVLDVDEGDGGVRLSKRGTLKNEARSKNHLLTHRYKNPLCEFCVRAKMKHRKTFRGVFQRKLEKFGDLVTFDYVENRRIAEQDYGEGHHSSLSISSKGYRCCHSSSQAVHGKKEDP